MSMLTINVKHGLDLSDELRKAKQVAVYGVAHKCTSTAQVKHFGMKAVLSNAVLRKYVRCKTLKEVHNIVIPVPSQGMKYDGSEIYIPCLKAHIPFDATRANHPIEKICHLELDATYVHICCEVADAPARETTTFLGVDRNTTGHVAVACNPTTGSVLMLGKKCQHVHKKYMHIRRNHQKEAKQRKHHKFRKLKNIKRRESNIVRNENHHISKAIVKRAVEENATIVFEDLKSIRETSKRGGRFKYSLNSWSFYQLQVMVEYKAKLQGVPVVYVNPEDTSQDCSRCGEEGIRKGKTFVCPHCGHTAHADVNAGFNIAKRALRGGRT